MILDCVQTLSAQPERDTFFAIFADGAGLAFLVVIGEFRKTHDGEHALPFVRVLFFQFTRLNRHPQNANPFVFENNFVIVRGRDYGIQLFRRSGNVWRPTPVAFRSCSTLPMRLQSRKHVNN